MAIYEVRGVCLGCEVCFFCEGRVEEEEDARKFLPHPLDAALNRSLPAKLQGCLRLPLLARGVHREGGQSVSTFALDTVRVDC